MNLRSILKPLAWITLTLALSACLERLGLAPEMHVKIGVAKNTLAANVPVRN